MSSDCHLPGRDTGMCLDGFVGAIGKGDFVAALAGNPNTGKSTLFNALTGLRQHTGNWPGKTVVQAAGSFRHKGKEVVVVDLPGTYSLLADSPEEQIARDFISLAGPSVTVIVMDATCLERNLNLVFQVTEITPKVVVCVNLIDEARRKGLQVDAARLEERLGVPVVLVSARTGTGLEALKDAVCEVAGGELSPKPVRLQYSSPLERAVESLEPDVKSLLNGRFNTRWVSLRLIEGDASLMSRLLDAGRGEGAGIRGIPAEKTPAGAGELTAKARFLRLGLGETVQDEIVATIYRSAESAAAEAVSPTGPRVVPPEAPPSVRLSVQTSSPASALPSACPSESDTACRTASSSVSPSACTGACLAFPASKLSRVLPEVSPGVCPDCSATVAESLSGPSPGSRKRDWDRKVDDIVTSRILGYPVMLLLLGAVFWLTLLGANYPSQLLAGLFSTGERWLSALFQWMGAPGWLHGVLVLGTYRALGWVVAVMLPPMAIFFPIFTLLEDLGYLPRVAFNLDGLFRRAGAHGKQALTMAMGFGCNAAGVVAARIIESPRERLIAIMTNNFVPCNGRFPTLIAMAAIFMGTGMAAPYGGMVASAVVVGLVMAGIGTTLLVSWVLANTLLKGVPSSFTLELPPYRPPQVLQVLARSVLDRTLFVLVRAVSVAAPAGAVVWLLANIRIGDLSVVAHAAGWLDPFGRAVGLDGFVVLAFILGLPANEIVVPILLMSYLAAGSMVEVGSLSALRELLLAQGWTWLTGLNLMLFSLLHFPCATALRTIRQETGSFKWTALSALIPTAVASLVTFTVAQGARLLGIV